MQNPQQHFPPQHQQQRSRAGSNASATGQPFSQPQQQQPYYQQGQQQQQQQQQNFAQRPPPQQPPFSQPNYRPATSYAQQQSFSQPPGVSQGFSQPPGAPQRFNQPPGFPQQGFGQQSGAPPSFSQPPGQQPPGGAPRFVQPPGTSQAFNQPPGMPQRFPQQQNTPPTFSQPPGSSQAFSRPPGTSQAFGPRPGMQQGFSQPPPNVMPGFSQPPNFSQGFNAPPQGFNPAQQPPGPNQQFQGRPHMTSAQQFDGRNTGPQTAADMQLQAQNNAAPVDDISHKKRAAYPKALATAYSGGNEVDPFGSGQSPQDAAPYDNQQQSYPQGGMAAEGVPQPSQNFDVNAAAGQFSNMSMDGSGASSMGPRQLNPVGLLGTPPIVSDIDAPPPPILLSLNASVTKAPTSLCDPSFKRCTINAVPQTPGLLSKSRLPFGLIITPFRSAKKGEEPVPTVSDNTITRCRRCRTYINPFVQFVEAGHRWKCNLCYLLNDVPSTFDYDSVTGQPIDRWQRTELNNAVVEFVAPPDYMIRPPQPLVYLFIIDVSYSAVQSGMVATAAKTILDALDRIPNEEKRTKIGFITVDSSVHFYSLGPEQQAPQMLVVSDLEGVYLPQPEDLLCNMSESRAVVETFLSGLGDMFKETQNVGNALGPALEAGHKLISETGGKIIVLQSTLPNAGEGALKPREDPKLLGTAKEASLLLPASPFYKNLAVDCSRTQTTIDMFLFGSQYADVASLGCAPRYTGGTTFFYPGFNAGSTEDAVKFAQELADHIAAPIGLEAVLRVRASKGLRMVAYHGNFFVRSTDLLALPTVTQDHSYAVEVAIDENVSSGMVSFQTALLYTTCYGERRIRVLTLALPVTTVMSELYASVDQMAVINLLGKKAVERALSSKLEDARDALVNKLIDILGVYKTCLTASQSGATAQLTLCSNMKLLPLMVLGLTKHIAFKHSSRIPSDLRGFAMSLLNIFSVDAVISYVHPRFYALHRLPPDVGDLREDGTLTMPPPLNLSSEKLERHGVYLLETGENSFFWISKDVHPQLCVDLFDVPNGESMVGGKFTLPTLDTDVSIATHLILSYLRSQRKSTIFPHTYIVKEDGEPSLRMWFLSYLIEDRTGEDISYHQFLGSLKDKVNNGSF